MGFLEIVFVFRFGCLGTDSVSPTFFFFVLCFSLEFIVLVGGFSGNRVCFENWGVNGDGLISIC